MKRVLLVNMPFSGLHYPALGISLLKAGLDRAGFSCDILYLNLAFAERVCRAREDVVAGVGAFSGYREMEARFVLLGDWLFAADLFGQGTEVGGHLEEIVAAVAEPQLRQNRALAEVDLQAMSRRALEMRAHVTPFFVECMERIDWHA